MMIDCRQVKQILPLWIGQDLPDASSVNEIARHLEKCPDCEKRRIGLQNSLEILQGTSVGALPGESGVRTLWPQLVSRISDWERTHRRERFNGWIPASVMALAVALMIAVSIPSIRDEFFRSGSDDVNVADLFDSVPEFQSESDLKANQGAKDSVPGRRPAKGTAVNYKPEQW